jgi:hypothetical protein
VRLMLKPFPTLMAMLCFHCLKAAGRERQERVVTSISAAAVSRSADRR